MSFSFSPWSALLLAEGFLFLGLGIGIWGSRSAAPSTQAAVFFGAAALVSLLAGWGLQLVRRRKPAEGPRRGSSKAVDLNENFRACLRHGAKTPLLQHEGLFSESLVLSTRTRIELAPGETLVLECWSGGPLSVITEDSSQRLEAGQILRLSSGDRPLEALLAPESGESPRLVNHRSPAARN